MPSRYGTGELYAFDFCTLSPARIRGLSSAPLKSQPCPFKPAPKCHKKGGVCSLRLLERGADGQVEGKGEPVITCPSRFREADLVSQWVGETLLGTPKPVVISELPFLMGEIQAEEGKQDAAGKIDEVLVHPDGGALWWCALEFQAVYFSGKSMENEFKPIREWAGPGVPFPAVRRRPGFRSFGSKRLMPQLQTKVPTISRWASGGPDLN